MAQENLSEVLFKPQFNYPETSCVVNGHSGDAGAAVGELMDNDNTPGWYRLLRRAQWAWQGADPILVESTLAKIAISTQQRSNDALLDTVSDYKPGNWVYEWMQPAAKLHHEAKAALEQEDFTAARKAFYLASQYYAISGYPHLKGDELAVQAQALANVCYREAGKLLKCPLKVIEVPFQGKTIQCYLHLAQIEEVSPVVVVCGSVDVMQLEYYTLFEKHLEPAGMAMLTVDIPGGGYASHYRLDQDSTKVMQAVVQHLKKVPWIDHDRVALLGGRLGANLVTRLAYLEPFSIKAAVSLGGAVDQVFIDEKRFRLLPQMLLDAIASRMEIRSDDKAVMYQFCKIYSLSMQGLLGRSKTKVPILSIGHKQDVICPESDIRKVANGSFSGETIIIDKPPIFTSYYRALDQAAEWLKLHLMK
ncbi:esterase FrsA [Motilimonas pumila]|uniref:Esterase FrsA n=1 Tax=Motilimonas pumila TaxID=2303987 RepID=A0A418YJV5_9GAMM|nr:esterase FrsA [Motilimonas pumila]RJG51243.1 esterase FrsA [Motilimonas pumila]